MSMALLSRLPYFVKMGSLWIYLILSMVSSANAIYSWSSEGALRRSLFTSYEKDSRPSSTVIIRCNIKLLAIKDLNTRDQTMSSVAYFSFTWLDSRLNWTNNNLYNNDIQAIYSTESTVFTPPIVVENSVSDLGLIRDLTLPIEILKTGDITWTPGDVYDTSCDIDTTYYPFDVQTCVITLTTRGYSNNQLSLKLGKVPIVQTAYQENGEWTLVTTSSSTSITNRDLVPYSQINFSFTFKRRIGFHLMNTIIPMFLLVSMTCFVFRIPVDAGEKLGYCLTVLLAFAVYLTLVSDNIPTTSTHTSYISVYLNVMLSLGISSVLFTIHILTIHFKPEEEEIPGYLRTFAKFSCRVCCCKSEDTKVSVIAVSEKENEVNKQNTEKENREFTWQEIAKKIDALLFWMYAFMFALLSLVFGIIMTIGSYQ